MPHERKARSAPFDLAEFLRPASRALLLGLLLLHAPALLAQGLTFTHFAGTTGGWGYFDGPASQASFARPTGVAVDAAGNIFVADSENGTLRRISTTGEVTTFVGLSGSVDLVDGRGAAARFWEPTALAFDAQGNLYVADRGNDAIRKVSPSGDVTTLAMCGWDHAGVAVDPWGIVYFVESWESRVGRISPTGNCSTLAGTYLGWSTDGPGTSARFNKPVGVAVDPSGNVYVADRESHTVRKIAPEGMVTTLAGRAGTCGSADGVGSNARFCYPAGVAVDAAGNVFVADENNSAIRKITPEGVVTTIASPATATGPGDRLLLPRGIAIDPGGDLIVADTENGLIRRVTLAGVVITVAGQSAQWGFDDGPASAARFVSPAGAAFDADGGLLVSDRYGANVRKVAPDGAVSTVAGLGGSWGSDDGVGSAARFSGPSGLAVTIQGRVLVVDSFNHTVRVISPEGAVSTLAGFPDAIGLVDGAGSNARFDYPEGIAVDNAGNAYVADTGNHAIRKVTPSGLVSTLAGGTRGSADGIGTFARFSSPTGVAMASDGFLYVADRRNHTIRRVSADGTVTTLAGSAGFGWTDDGTGSAARFYHPTAVAIDLDGNLLVADQEASLLRKVTPTGTVTTIGGHAWYPGATAGTGPDARFNRPEGIAVSSTGEVFLADSRSRSIRQGRPALFDVATIDATAGPVGQVRQLGVSPQTGSSWLWEVVRRPTGSAAVLQNTTLPNPTFTPDVPDTYLFRLTTSDGIRTSITTVPLTASVTALVSGAAAICVGGSAVVKATLAGTPPWTLTWSDGFVQSDVTASPVTRTVSPALTTTYAVTEVGDASGPGSTNGSATILVSGPPPPDPPVISAPAEVGAGSWYRIASVTANPGSSYYWTITNGTIVAGQGSPRLTFTAPYRATVTLTVYEETPGGCRSPDGTATVSVTAPGSNMAFYTVTPCRLVDTREPGGGSGGTPLAAGEQRSWYLNSSCGVPDGARALSTNVTVAEPTAAGYLILYASYASLDVSTLNFGAGQTRANNVIVPAPGGLYLDLAASNESPGTVHVIVDVNGFFQ